MPFVLKGGRKSCRLSIMAWWRVGGGYLKEFSFLTKTQHDTTRYDKGQLAIRVAKHPANRKTKVNSKTNTMQLDTFFVFYD